MKKVILGFLLMSASALVGCKKEEIVPPQPILFKDCDPALGGTREKCAALDDVDLYAATTNYQQIGSCWIQVATYDWAYDGIRVAISREGMQPLYYPDATLYSLKHEIASKNFVIESLRQAILKGLCGL